MWVACFLQPHMGSWDVPEREALVSPDGARIRKGKCVPLRWREEPGAVRTLWLTRAWPRGCGCWGTPVKQVSKRKMW